MKAFICDGCKEAFPFCEAEFEGTSVTYGFEVHFCRRCSAEIRTYFKKKRGEE